MNRVDKIIKYSLYLLLFLPLAFTSFTFFPWHFGKTVIFQIIVEALAVLFLLGWATRRGRGNCPPLPEGGRGGEGERRLNWLDCSILFFLLIITLTAFTGVNPGNSFWGNQARANGVFTWWHFGAFYFLLAWFFRSNNVIASPPTHRGAKQSRSFFLIAVIVAVLASLTALFSNLLPASWQSISGGGIIGNRAFLASYLVLAIGLSLYLFANYMNKWRWLFLAAPVLFIYTIIDTGNRGALLGIVAGFFLGLVLCLFLVRDKRIKIWSAISLIVLCSLFFVLLLSRQSLFLQRNFPAAASLANISLSSGTTETRLMAWQSAWQGFKEKPLLGWGWGNYNVVFDKYYNPQFLKHSFAETVWDKPHNWLLEIGVTAGILGVLGYLAIYIFTFYYLLKKNVVGTGLKPVPTTGKIILAATLVTYFVAGLFLFETTNALILWFLMLAMISSSVANVETQNFASLPPQSNTIKKNVFSKIFNIKYPIFFIFISLISLSLYYFHCLPLKSSYYMRQAELSTVLMDWTGFADRAIAVGTGLKPVPTFLSENVVFLAEQFTKFDKAGVIAKEKKIEDTALKITGVLENASSKYPDNLSFPVWAGQVYMVLGEKMDEKYYQKAEESLLKAEKISPQKQEVLFLLGRFYLLKKDFDQALSFQKKAVAAAPEINTSHWFLGLTYVAQGERAKGLEEIEKAVELGYNLTIDQKLYVLDLYALEKNYSKLIEEYKKLIEAEPENVNWYIKLAVAYAEVGDKKAALEMVREAINLYPPIKSEAEKFIKEKQLE